MVSVWTCTEVKYFSHCLYSTLYENRQISFFFETLSECLLDVLSLVWIHPLSFNFYQDTAMGGGSSLRWNAWQFGKIVFFLDISGLCNNILFNYWHLSSQRNPGLHSFLKLLFTPWRLYGCGLWVYRWQLLIQAIEILPFKLQILSGGSSGLSGLLSKQLLINKS